MENDPGFKIHDWDSVLYYFFVYQVLYIYIYIISMPIILAYSNKGESSFFYWGFFNSKFTSHEYGENYIIIPMAEKMLKENSTIAAEWATYKEDNPSYAEDPGAVVDWFFVRTAYYDAESYLFPVGIEM
jgi:hypothetical protein